MALGKLKIPVNKRQYFLVTGGPFMECPSNMKGVKMAKEIRQYCDVDIPTVDFNVPDPKDLSAGLEQAVDMLLKGEPLYVGCMGGKGRTGLFMAVLVKAFGVPKPVEYVRANYYSHAVETKLQYAYVTEFSITPRLKKKIQKYRRWVWMQFWKRNMTRMPKLQKDPRRYNP